MPPRRRGRTETLHEADFATLPLSGEDLDAVSITLRKLRAGAGDFSP